MPAIAIDPTAPGPQLLAHAASILRRGGLVAFPTETVYGLGANALDEAAVMRIFEAKGRPSANPLIVHVADVRDARRLTTAWPAAADALAAAFWPGPLTIVLPKQPHVPDLVTAGLPNVALRVPAHGVARALLIAADLPIAAPSANRYTHLSPTTAAHVERALGDQVDLILDGGPTRVGIESAVIDLTGDVPRLLRPGIIAPEALRALLGELVVEDEGHSVAEGVARSSPGMSERHYAPRARLELFDASGRDAAIREAEAAAARGERVGALLLAPFCAPVHEVVRMPADPVAYAHSLYAALHQLDDAGCDRVFVEQVPTIGAWAGVRDRLERGAR